MIAVMLGTMRTGDVAGVIMITVEVAATTIVAGITTGIETVIVGVMMTERDISGRGTKFGRCDYFLDFFN